MGDLAPGDNEGESAGSSRTTDPASGVGEGPSPPTSVSRVTPSPPTTVISETPVEILDRGVGPEAPRRERLFAAASAKGVPLRTILAVDGVVIATWVAYRLIGRLREVILWILIAAFIALVLNPAVHFLQRHSLRRGVAIGLVFAGAAILFAGMLGLFGYPLVNSLTHVAKSLPTMVSQLQKGHGWLAHTLQRFHLLTWVQKNAPKLETAAKNLSKPALSEGTNLAGAVFGTILSLFTIAFLSLFMLLEAPRLRAGLLGSMRPDRRRVVEDIAHRVAHQVTGYVLGTVALSLMFGVVILVTLLILGVPFALLIGLWVALVAAIPLVGGLIAAVPSVLIALLHSPSAGLVTLIVFVGFQLIENHFIYPVVMSRSVRMNPLWVLLSVLIGANLGGVFGSALGALAGALVAIPVGGAIQVILGEIWDKTRATPDGPTAATAGSPPVETSDLPDDRGNGPAEGVAARNGADTAVVRTDG